MRSAPPKTPGAETGIDPAQLVRRTRAGERSAFDRLVRAYQNAALATACRYLARAEDAPDIVQDAFVEAYCKLAQLQQPERFGGWLCQIVRARALDWTRRRQKVSFTSDAGGAAEAAIDAASVQAQGRQRASGELWDAVGALPEGMREVVLLYYRERQPYREVGRRLGLSVSAVNARLRAARIALREKLSEGDESYMTSVQLENQVKESICQIATEDVQVRVPLAETEHVVLFCGLESAIEVCHTDGDAVVVSGSKSAVGLSDAEARSNLEGVAVLGDQVASYDDAGPHPGEMVLGATIEDDDLAAPEEIKSYVQSTAAWMDRIRGGMTSFRPGDGLAEYPSYHFWNADGLYGEMQPREGEITGPICEQLAGPATRISAVCAQAAAIVLPRAGLTESVRRVFTPTNAYENKVHGGAVRVDLVVAVPTGVAVTVLRADKLSAAGLRGDLNVVEGDNVELRDCEGALRLFDTSVRRAENIRGAFYQTRYDLIGGSMSDGYNLFRAAAPPTVLKNIEGTVRVDLARGDLQVADLHGDIEIRNRFGQTHCEVADYREGTRYHLEADSGAVRVAVAEPLCRQLHFTFHTVCGHIDAGGLQAGDATGLNPLSAGHLLSLTTRDDPDVPEAAVVVTTRDGDIAVTRA